MQRALLTARPLVKQAFEAHSASTLVYPDFPLRLYHPPVIPTGLIGHAIYPTRESFVEREESMNLARLQKPRGRSVFAKWIDKPGSALVRKIPKDNAGRWRLLQQTGVVRPDAPLPEWAAAVDAAGTPNGKPKVQVGVRAKA
jgi:hypothetical protein